MGQQSSRLDRPRDVVHGKVTVSLPPAKVQDKRAEHWRRRDRGVQQLVSG